MDVEVQQEESSEYSPPPLRGVVVILSVSFRCLDEKEGEPDHGVRSAGQKENSRNRDVVDGDAERILFFLYRPTSFHLSPADRVLPSSRWDKQDGRN